MGIFSKAEKTTRPKVPVTLAQTPVVKTEPMKPLMTQQAVAQKTSETPEIVRVREVFDSLGSEIRESAEQQQSAMRRMSILSDIIARMELDLKAMRRLKKENSALSESERDLKSKVSQKTAWANELDSRLSDLERRYTSTQENLKIAESELAALKDHGNELETTISEKDAQISDLTVRSQSNSDKLSHLETTNDKLQQALDSHMAQLSKRNRDSVELQNALDEMSSKFDSKSKQNESLTSELKNLRVDHADIKSRHVELSGKYDNLRFDIQTQKNVFEDTVKRREEENLSLKTRIDQLETQLRIKENMATHLDQEFIGLRNALVGERDRADSLDNRLRSKTEELDRNVAALAKGKYEYDSLNKKFAAALEDYETLRKLNQIQREKLERYAVITSKGDTGPVLRTDLNQYDAGPSVQDTDVIQRLSTAKQERSA